MRTLSTLLLLAACGGGGNEYIVEGTVYEKPSPTRIVVDHEDIRGFMPAMVMPFDVRDAALLADVSPGDTIVARLQVEQNGAFLEKVRVTGRGVVPADYAAVGTDAVLPGAELPTLQVPTHDGSVWTIGPGQPEATAITFAYTRCPIPDYCPLTMRHMAALQSELAGDARVLVVTLDPEFDTNEVLTQYAATHGAVSGEMALGRLTGDDLAALTKAAGLSIDTSTGEILHGLRLMVTDANGALIERYDDNRYPMDRVVSQLRTGEPKAPPGSEGTMTAPDSGSR